MPEQGTTYTFEDASGSHSTPTDDPNPYHALINDCANDPTQIQARYSTHRTTRALQQRALLLSPDFPGVNVDPILSGVLKQAEKDGQRGVVSEAEAREGGEGSEGKETERFEDHRHNLVLWARPPQRLRDVVGECQRRLREIVPDIWLMPLPSLHMTALEFTHSATPATISSLVTRLEPLQTTLIDYLHTAHSEIPPRRVRLVKPMLTYDAAAVALSLLPAEGKPGDEYGYHHLRASLWEVGSVTSRGNLERAKREEQEGREGKVEGVEINTRYIVPSAHLTIARFVTEEGARGREAMGRWVRRIEEVNAWLEREHWGEHGLEWMVGEEKGLDFRRGACWYGGGESVAVGRGF